MLKVLLYGIATFLETGIGIWFFGKMFPKRERMERRHYFAEWILYTILMITACTFPTAFFKLKDEEQYTNIVMLIYCTFLVIYIGVVWKKKKCPDMERFLLIGMIISLTAQNWASFISMPMIVLGNIFPVLFLYCFYKCSFFQAYLWENSYLIISGIIKVIYITLYGAFEKKSFRDYLLPPRKHMYSEVICCILIYLLMYYLLQFELSKNVIQKIMKKQKKILIMINIFLIFIIRIVINQGYGKIKDYNLSLILVLFVGVILFLVILFVKSYRKSVESEKKLLYIRNEAVQTQYEEMSVSYEKYRQLVHDEKHMVSYVSECLRRGENKVAQDFLQDFQEVLITKEEKVWSGIKSLNLILNVKFRKIKDTNIKFLCDLNVDYIPMTDADFVIMMGNLLDNAIEAAEQCKEGDRFIELHMKNTNHIFMCKIKNSCIKKASRNKLGFVTEKKEKEKHGLGIESVQYIINQYKGKINYIYDNRTFEVRIILSDYCEEMINER